MPAISELLIWLVGFKANTETPNNLIKHYLLLRNETSNYRINLPLYSLTNITWRDVLVDSTLLSVGKGYMCSAVRFRIIKSVVKISGRL